MSCHPWGFLPVGFIRPDALIVQSAMRQSAIIAVCTKKPTKNQHNQLIFKGKNDNKGWYAVCIVYFIESGSGSALTFAEYAHEQHPACAQCVGSGRPGWPDCAT
ncbi:hypothetical protein EMIT053CA3_250002 [Pseudomonas donghuensis]